MHVDRRLSVSKIEGITLLGRGATLSVKESAQNLTLRDTTGIVLSEWKEASNLRSEGDAALTANSGAVVTELSGKWRLKKVAEAHFHGGPDDFQIASVDDAAGAVITAFQLSDPQQRRRALDTLSSSHHLDPSVKNLPGRGAGYNSGLWRRTQLNEEQRNSLHADTEFVRKLAEVARARGAPGATRTRIAWCAYRLRQISARGWERRALAGYRFLGYGERPGPAFLTWLVLAALSVPVVMGGIHDQSLDPSPPGIGQFALNVLQQAASPIGALLDTGSPDPDSSKWSWAEYPIRALIAIPLVTGALAIRNFVKQGR